MTKLDLRAGRTLLALLGGASSLALALAGGETALADDAPAGANDTTEVVVTASRRKEQAIDVPIAVSSISGERLDVLNSSGLDIRFLSAVVPSLEVESSFGRTYPRFYIRGLGNSDYDINAAQPVSIVYNDIALDNPLLKSFPVFDLADVEVLRGPQGSEFGRNTPAGVVKLDSAKPSETFGGYGSLSYGTFDTINAEGAVTGSLGNGFTARLSVLEQRRDNWVTNTDTSQVLAPHRLGGYIDTAARFQLAYASGNFDGLLDVHVRGLEGSPELFRAGIFQQGSNNFVAGFKPSLISLDGVVAQRMSQDGVDLHLNYRLDGLGTLKSITGFEQAKVVSNGDIDGGGNYTYPPLGLNNALFYDSTGGASSPIEFSQEFRFESLQFGPYRGQAGFYFFDQDLTYSELDFTPTGSVDSDVEHKNKAISYGAYASGEYKATDALTIRAGLRYTSDMKKDHIWGSALFPGVTLPTANKVTGDNVSGDISATYVVTKNVNLYARLATGYLAPAIQDRVNFGSVPDTVKAEDTISGEIGVKTQLFDKKLSVDFDIYDFTTKDMQLTAVGGASNSAALLNAKEAVGHGAELEIRAKPIDHLLITGGLSYNYTEIRDPNLSVAPCGSGVCTVENPIIASGPAAGNALINGNPLPQAPQEVANFTARYGIPAANGDEYFIFTDWAYRSKVNYFLYEAAEFTGRSELTGGLRIGYLTADRLEVAVYVRNITNQIRSESAIDFNNLTGMINDPRTFGVNIRKAF